MTIAVAAAMMGCAQNVDSPVEITLAPVYGTDDRQEYFQVVGAEQRSRMLGSTVALIAKVVIGSNGSRIAEQVPSLGETVGLCAGEPFADQPAAAFCSGVLVDWDLVLTAGHCVRLFALQDFAVVFNYDYVAPGKLDVADDDIVDVVDIVDEALDPEGTEPRLDYAWLRLVRPVVPPRQPAPLYVGGPSPLKLNDPILSIGAAGGIPMKFDAGGKVRDLRESWSDYFIADADVFHGSSGGGAFDLQLSLVGIMARGGIDTVVTQNGCSVIRREPDGLAAQEQFTYVHRAAEGLCRRGTSVSSICRADCGRPCQALPLPAFVASGGCTFAVAKRGSTSATGHALLFTLLLAGLRARCSSIGSLWGEQVSLRRLRSRLGFPSLPAVSHTPRVSMTRPKTGPVGLS